MDEQLLSSLADELQTEFNALKGLKAGSEEYSRHVSNIEKLWKLGQAEVKNVQDQEEIEYRRNMDAIKADQDKKDKKLDRFIQIGIKLAEIGVPTAVYVILWKSGLQFEKTGIISSSMMRNLIQKLPWKK